MASHRVYTCDNCGNSQDRSSIGYKKIVFSDLLHPLSTTDSEQRIIEVCSACAQAVYSALDKAKSNKIIKN